MVIPNVDINNLDAKQFGSLNEFIRQHTGIILAESNQLMFYHRVASRMRHLNIAHIDDYVRLLENQSGSEFNILLNASTINFTSFYREKYHFQYLTDTLFPELMSKNVSKKRIRIWCSACSSGEEAYSLAIVLKEAIRDSSWDIKILATDLDTNMLQNAGEGIYGDKQLHSISEIRRKRWFKDVLEKPGFMQISPEIKNMIEFRQLNLVKEWRHFEKFDIVFCRNVLIYFDVATRKSIVERFASYMNDGGALFIGSTESLQGVTSGFHSEGKSIYRFNQA